jgi:hypothetical protein
MRPHRMSGQSRESTILFQRFKSMSKNHTILGSFLLVLNLLCLESSSAQTGSDLYKLIKDQPSKTHWCLPEAGDDPANIIGGRCKIYEKCLQDLNVDEKVDQQPYPDLPAQQITKVKSCHQALFDAARSNPQIKGSRATQDWLQHSVFPGTEAKSFPVPDSFPAPR